MSRLNKMEIDKTSVRLRYWKIEDAMELAAIINNKRLLDNLRDDIPFPYRDEDAEDYIRSVLAAEKDTQYIYAVTYGGRVVGNVGAIRQDDIHRLTAELGYYFDEAFWGKGIATEAVRQICAYLFTFTDIIRIFAEPFVFNRASCRVLEKAGFELEGVMRKNAIKNGQIVDMNLYALTKALTKPAK